jgi:hypothetical protein
MALGIPRPSFLEVPDLFSLLDSPRNRFYHSSDPRVLAKIPGGSQKYQKLQHFLEKFHKKNLREKKIALIIEIF